MAYWQSGAYVDAQNPLFGVPRSEILNNFNFSVVWNPHDIILWAIAISGVIGLAFAGLVVTTGGPVALSVVNVLSLPYVVPLLLVATIRK